MMNDAIVILAALPGEIKPLVRSWAALETVNNVDGWQHPNGPVMAFAGGMGSAAAARAFGRALQVCKPITILSVGWAGALLDETTPGTVIKASMVRDLNTGEMYASDGAGGLLLTASRVASHDEKLRLANTYTGSVAVDMEAATIARLSLANGLGFRAIKAVSDTLHEDLPDMNPFLTPLGRFATPRFIAHVATKPRYWSALAQFGKQASLAANNLCNTLADEIGVERPR